MTFISSGTKSTESTNNSSTANIAGSSTLNGQLSAGAQTITINSVSSFPSGGGTCKIISGNGTEYITYTSINGSILEGISRGAYGTSDVSHVDGSAISGVYIGTSEKNNLIDVMTSLKSNQVGTLYYDFSVNGSDWDTYPTAGFSIAVNTHEFHTAIKGNRYFRVRFENSANNEVTSFRLYTYYGIFKQSNLPLSQEISADADSTVVRAVITGQDPIGSFVNSKEGGIVLSTDVPLGSNESYVSGILDTNGFTQIQLSLFANTTGIFTGQWFADSAGTNVVRNFVVPYTATGTLQNSSAPVFSRYFKFHYTNGDTAQTNFFTEFKFLTGAISSQTLGVESFIASSMVCNLSRNVSVGKKPDGDYVNVPADGSAFSTTTNLLATSDYTSSWVDTDGWNSIEIFITADQESAEDGIVIEFTDDSGADTPIVRGNRKFTYTANNVEKGSVVYRVAPVLDGFRIRYTNGTVDQTSFYLDATLKTNSSNNLYNSSQALEVADFLSEVAIGNISNYSIDTKFGRNPGIDTGSVPEDIWEAGGVYTGQPSDFTPATVDIVSTSENDSSTDTGARVMRFFGLKTTTDTEYTYEDITLNGTNAVTSSDTWWRINRAYIKQAGSGEENAGTISITSNGVGSPLFATIIPGRNQTEIAAYTVPFNKVVLIKNIKLYASRSGDNITLATVSFRVKDNGVYRSRAVYDVSSGYIINDSRLGGIRLGAGADIKMTVESVSANSTVINGSFEYILINV